MWLITPNEKDAGEHNNWDWVTVRVANLQQDETLGSSQLAHNKHRSLAWLPYTDILLGNTHGEKEGNLVPDTKSLSQHKAFPIFPIFPSFGGFQGGFALKLGAAVEKQPRRLHRADWGTVPTVHSRVRRSGRGRIVVWASFYPGSMAQRKGWLVCPISKVLPTSLVTEIKAAAHVEERRHCHAKGRNRNPAVHFEWGETLGSAEGCLLERHFFRGVLRQTRLTEETRAILPRII